MWWSVSVSTTNISRDEAAVRSAGLEVHDYRTTVDVRQAVDTDRAHAPVHCVVEVTSRLQQTFLDSLEGKVHRIVVNGTVQPVSYDGSRITVDLQLGRNIVEIDASALYSRTGQGLHRFVDPLDGNTYLYTQFEPADARRLYPCFDQPDLKAVHHVTVLAPEGWTVRSNQPRVTGGPIRDEIGTGVRHAFAPTPLLSTYLVCIAAGPWHEVRDVWASEPGSEELTVELGALCRQSLAPHLDTEAILGVTKQGLDFYHREFGFPYPWGKYDSIFVPEYNLGAMENPGLVTFTENYLPRSAATRAQYQGRANTILHEMAHMWFGDLVTPAWWDDLWLKESFAEFMGSHASVVATEFTDAWVAFAGRRKAWAYQQDQLPTTHPIVADIADVEAAAQNFDGITYAKGAAVLKQLVAHVGREDFFAGSRAYFQAHAYSSARLADLLDALQEASGRDLQAWSRAWLQTAGPDTLTPVLETADGRITRLAVEQVSVDARDGSPVGRPHTMAVGLYRAEGDELVRYERLDVELDGRPVTEVGGAIGLEAPALVLLNDEDLTYAKVGLDDVSRRTVLDGVGRVSDPLARALCWSSLWNLTRDAGLSAADYVATAVEHGVVEPDAATQADVLNHALQAVEAFTPDDRRPEAAHLLADGLWQSLDHAAPGSDRQLALARVFARTVALAPAQADRAQGLLDGSLVLPALDLGPELRWSLATSLAALGRWNEAELDAELARDGSADCVTARLGALASRPDAQVKEDVWQQAFTPRALTNDHLGATIAGFMAPGQQALRAPFVDRYFAALDTVWSDHPSETAKGLAAGLFPDCEDAPERAAAWLAARPQAPDALRRIVIEQADRALRARRAREANA